MTYIDRLNEINDIIRSKLIHDGDIDIDLINERMEIIDSVRYRHEHNWDDEKR